MVDFPLPGLPSMIMLRVAGAVMRRYCSGCRVDNTGVRLAFRGARSRALSSSSARTMGRMSAASLPRPVWPTREEGACLTGFSLFSRSVSPAGLTYAFEGCCATSAVGGSLARGRPAGWARPKTCSGGRSQNMSSTKSSITLSECWKVRRAATFSVSGLPTRHRRMSVQP